MSAFGFLHVKILRIKEGWKSLDKPNICGMFGGDLLVKNRLWVAREIDFFFFFLESLVLWVKLESVNGTFLEGSITTISFLPLLCQGAVRLATFISSKTHTYDCKYTTKNSNTLLSDSVHVSYVNSWNTGAVVNTKSWINFCKEFFFYSAVYRQQSHTKILTKSLWQRTWKHY